MTGAINGLTVAPISSADDGSSDPIIATLMDALKAVQSKHMNKARMLIEDALYAVSAKDD